MSKHALGKMGEQSAVEFLQAKGYVILERNYRIKLGEIDLIARDQKTICFIEVKTRESLNCGMPYESVHYFKQKTMVKVAFAYLKHKFHTVDVHARFDVVSIFIDGIHKNIYHILNAFDLNFLR